MQTHRLQTLDLKLYTSNPKI